MQLDDTRDAGADPSKLIEELAKRKKIKTLGVSMGQGQEVIARKYVATAMAEGRWVLLQNTHLGLGYLSEVRTHMLMPYGRWSRCAVTCTGRGAVASLAQLDIEHRGRMPQRDHYLRRLSNCCSRRRGRTRPSGCGSRRSRTRRFPLVSCRWASRSRTRRRSASVPACVLLTSGSRRRASAHTDARLRDLRCAALTCSAGAAPLLDQCAAIKLTSPVSTRHQLVVQVPHSDRYRYALT